MKKILILAAFMMLMFIIPACSFKLQSRNTSNPKQAVTTAPSDQSQQNNANQPSPTTQVTSTPSPTIEPSLTSTPTPTVQPSQASFSITTDILKQNMEAVESYRRKIKTINEYEGKKSEKYEELAYIKKPFSSHILLDFIGSGSYSEDIVINGINWMRMKKTDKWDKYLPGEWFADPPRAFKYDICTLHYPVKYEKLTLQEVGRENVNGINCIKYSISGSYKDEFTFSESPKLYPIALSAKGEIWISDDPVIKQVIIKQRATFTADITLDELKDANGNPTHEIQSDTIEEDVVDINSTVINPPSDSETNQRKQ